MSSKGTDEALEKLKVEYQQIFHEEIEKYKLSDTQRKIFSLIYSTEFEEAIVSPHQLRRARILMTCARHPVQFNNLETLLLNGITTKVQNTGEILSAKTTLWDDPAYIEMAISIRVIQQLMSQHLSKVFGLPGFPAPTQETVLNVMRGIFQEYRTPLELVQKKMAQLPEELRQFYPRAEELFAAPSKNLIRRQMTGLEEILQNNPTKNSPADRFIKLLEDIKSYEDISRLNTPDVKRLFQLALTIRTHCLFIAKERQAIEEQIPRSTEETKQLYNLWKKVLISESRGLDDGILKYFREIRQDKGENILSALLSGDKSAVWKTKVDHYFPSLFRTIHGEKFTETQELVLIRLTDEELLLTLTEQHDTDRGKKTAATLLLEHIETQSVHNPRDKVLFAQEHVRMYRHGRTGKKIFRRLEPIITEILAEEQQCPPIRIQVEGTDFLSYHDMNRWTGICTKCDGQFSEEGYEDALDPGVFFIEEEAMLKESWKKIAEACIIKARTKWLRRTYWVVETVAAKEEIVKQLPQAYWMRTLYDGITRLAYLNNVHTVMFNTTLEERGRARQFLLYVAQIRKYIRETPEEYVSLHQNLEITDGYVIPKAQPFIKELFKKGTKRIGYFQSWANTRNWFGDLAINKNFQCEITENGWHPQRNNGQGYVLGIPVRISEVARHYPQDLAQQSIHYAIRDPKLREKADESIAYALRTRPIQEQEELLRTYATIKSRIR